MEDHQQVDPPFHETYKTLLQQHYEPKPSKNIGDIISTVDFSVEEMELPLIDLSRLSSDEEFCKEEIAKASKEWGFFQIINHGIPNELLEKMREEQVKVFKQSFVNKSKEKYMNYNFSAGTYRWGTPSATCLEQLAWSEAFHISMTQPPAFDSLSSIMEEFGTTVAQMAQKLAKILSEKMGHKTSFFQENCSPNTCYLRMNRYPPCPLHEEVFGLMPHTDSDFLTILHQDQVGGLQLIKNEKWISVKPNPDALIVNIGDLFQAWSNDIYKSVKHRVVTNPKMERFSTAYFFCPSYDTMVESCFQPSIYKKFTFGDYKKQIQDDVKKLGCKLGLREFLL